LLEVEVSQNIWDTATLDLSEYLNQDHFITLDYRYSFKSLEVRIGLKVAERNRRRLPSVNSQCNRVGGVFKQRVVERHASDAVYGPSLLRLGESLAALQRWARSEKAFTDYLERQADSEQWFQAQFGIGWARENQERHDEAIEAYRAVVARHKGPTAARAQFQIGECLFARKQYEDAARELLKVDILYAYPEWSAAALYEAGRCFEALGKTVEARTQFKAVVDKHKQTRWGELAGKRLAALSASVLPGRSSKP